MFNIFTLIGVVNDAGTLIADEKSGNDAAVIADATKLITDVIPNLNDSKLTAEIGIIDDLVIAIVEKKETIDQVLPDILARLKALA